MGQSEANYLGIDLTGSGEGRDGIETKQNESQFQTDELKASLDSTSSGHTTAAGNHCGDSGRSEASEAGSLIDTSQLEEMSTTSEEFGYFDDSEFDVDVSVHSEFIPISKHVHREHQQLRFRSKSTSDLTEDPSSAYPGNNKDYNAQFLRFSQLWDTSSQHGSFSDYGTPDSDWNDDFDRVSIHSDIIPMSYWSSVDRTNLFRSKSTSELEKYSQHYINAGLEFEQTQTNVGNALQNAAETNDGFSTWSDSDSECYWSGEMFRCDSAATSMSMSIVEPYINRGSKNPNEFLMSICSNPNLQRSFSFGDIFSSLKSCN